jgi:class 3 adenylate cyclase/tetratricopeptide (TPR) repeat protein
MAACTACGVENDGDARFCKGCGSPLDEAAEREQRKTATLVFCDLVGSTTLGESSDPEAVKRLLARYFERMKAIVESHGGTVEKFIGDAVVAVFGVPVSHEDDALRALRAAVEMRDALPEVGVEGRIGVNSGEIVTSGFGTIVTGDAANVAARLEQAAGAGEVLVGAETVALAGSAIEVKELEPLALKGKAEPVPAFRLVAVGQALERSHATSFVGRARELAAVREAWERVVAEGRCELVTIVGEPGVGKSRLVAEFADGLDVPVVRGRCLSYGEGITYFPVVEAIRELNAAPADPHVAAVLQALLGETGAATSPDEIAWAFRELLQQEAPLVVVFDDIQWGEETFLDLVEHVALMSSGASLLLVCVARPELVERRPGWPIALRLEPLGPAEVDALLPASLPTGVRERIASASGGNPLFLTEIVAMTAETAGGELVVPPTLKALLAARLDRLEVAERDVLDRGSVEGEVFHQGPVQALTGSHVTSQLASLVRGELIRPDTGFLPGDEAFRFCHLLIRDAAYDSLPKAVRADLHERFADWLDEHATTLLERDELVGYHLQQAHQYHRELGDSVADTGPLGERTAACLVAASGRAAERADYHAVANLLERALALGLADARDRARAEIELGEALFETGRLAESDEAYTGARDRAKAAGASGLAATALVRRERQRLQLDPEVDIDELTAGAEEAIRTLLELDDASAQAVAEQLLAEIAESRGQSAAALARQEQGAALAARAGEHQARRRMVRKAANLLALGPTPAGQGVERCRELMRTSEDDPTLRATIGWNLGVLLAMGGRSEEALAVVEESSAVLDALDSMTWTWLGRWASGWARELADDRAGAERDLIAWCERLRDARGAESVPAVNARSRLALLYCDDGRWSDAEDCLAASREVTEPQIVLAAVTHLTAQARVASHRGDHGGAFRLARRGIELIDPTDCLPLRARLWAALADIHRAAGNRSEADAAVARALELYDQKGNIAGAAHLRARAAATPV